jgi:DNA polymerase/3'-5' exonuclease PolX
MSKRKQPKSRFVLEEEDGVVVASLLDDNDMSLQHTIHNMPHPRIRASRRTKSQIEDDSKFMASIQHESQKEFLKKNISGINKEINKHVQEIRKTLKRMQSLTHYVVTAQEVLDEIE